ncbi:MAG: transketolase [Bacilli bacterium]|nr:transketolase [Bacilli bacterium]
MAKFDDRKMVDDIRCLALDMINEAGSGHPGIVLGAAPIIYTLFTNHLNFDLAKRDWCARDRFVLSAGHGSALLYATLFCINEEDYNLNDLKNFRNIYSHTPGHPEYNLDYRIETTTGPLGQGFATAVGMAMAGKYLDANFGNKKISLFDYYVYTLVSDGDLMEGISYEAASIASKFNLDNLIVLYDANGVTLDGEVEDNYCENVAAMYENLGWEVIDVKKGDSIKEINKAITMAQKASRPTLIVVNTIIGMYSEYEGTNKIHGKLELDDYLEIRKELSDSGDKWHFDKKNLALYRQKIKKRVDGLYKDWYEDYEEYCKKIDDKELNRLNYIINNETVSLQLDKVIDTDKLFIDKNMRDINYQIMNVIAAFIPNFLGGSADVSNSTKTYLKGKDDFSIDNYTGRNIAFGIREHAMGAILNGLALSNLKVFGSTFLAFSDYLKPAIRLSAMMNLPVTYVFTHDSILVGQDGATHQPVEQLAMLRSIPNLNVYRPADYKELIGCWNEILLNNGPACLILPREHVATQEFTNSQGIEYGAYIISEVKKSLDVILIASGSEVELAMDIKEELLKNYVEARVVTVPCLTNFLKQDQEYINEVLPSGYRKVVIEFSNDANWYKLLEPGDEFISVNDYGKSGNSNDILKDFELDIPSLVMKIKNIV